VLFESDSVACATCHAGERLTDNRTYEVRTGAALQVPSLRGVAWRAPFIHDGAPVLWRIVSARAAATRTAT
jgi:cytochrome c peroxidase